MKKLMIVLFFTVVLLFGFMVVKVQGVHDPVGNSGKYWICHANLDPAGNPVSYDSIQVRFPDEYSAHLGNPAFPAPHQYDYDGKCQ